ncbi:LysE family translocator [Candidatus Bathyarchaeota archaeon]|nr:LysE family translocator [Candidatus Bathyarchaeota archaeon]
MDTAFLVKGLVIGFSIAAPVGPIGMLCIRRTLGDGRVAGLLSGLGAATADAIYGCIAGFGVVFVSTILLTQQVWLRLVGGVFLCYLGARTFLASPEERISATNPLGLAGIYLSTFFLTLTNPMTIISFAAIFAALGVGNTSGSYISAVTLVVGVFVGSALWWLILSSIVSLFRSKLKPGWLKWVNRLSGLVILGFGVLAILSLRL